MRKTAAEIVLEAAKRAGQDGISTADVSGATARAVEGAVQRLMQDNLLHKAKLGHRTVRYFVEPAWAETYLSRHQVHTPAAVRRSATARATWRADEPVIYPKDADGNPLYKVTIAPARQRQPGDPYRTNTHNEFV